MPINPLLPTAGAAGPAAPAGAGRKEEPGSIDSAFAALLAALVGAQMPMIQPAQAAESATDAPAGETAGPMPQLQALVPVATVAVDPEAAQAPASPVAAVPFAQAAPVPFAQVTAKAAPVPMAEALENLLQAQRVTVAPAEGQPTPQAVVQTVTPVTTQEITQVTTQVATQVVAQVVAQAAAQAPKFAQWVGEPLASDAGAPDLATPVSPPAQQVLPALADILTRAAFRSPDGGQALKAKSERQPSDNSPDTAATDLAPTAAFSVLHAAVAPTDAPTGAKAPAPIPSPIDPDRLMDAIAKAAVSSGDGRYTVTLHLHPEQLGEVHLQLHINGRDVQTTLQVSTPAAQQALQSKGDELKQSLDRNGMTLSGFHVATGQGERRKEQQFSDELTPRRRKGPVTGAAVAARPIRRLQTRRSSGFDTLA